MKSIFTLAAVFVAFTFVIASPIPVNEVAEGTSDQA
jgi:hypothetical protein